MKATDAIKLLELTRRHIELMQSQLKSIDHVLVILLQEKQGRLPKLVTSGGNDADRRATHRDD